MQSPVLLSLARRSPFSKLSTDTHAANLNSTTSAPHDSSKQFSPYRPPICDSQLAQHTTPQIHRRHNPSNQDPRHPKHFLLIPPTFPSFKFLIHIFSIPPSARPLLTIHLKTNPPIPSRQRSPASELENLSLYSRHLTLPRKQATLLTGLSHSPYQKGWGFGGAG